MDTLRVGVLCSHRAPGLGYLLDHDASRGRLYDVGCCLTSEESCPDASAAEEHGIPMITHPIRRFCRTHGWRLSDPAGRAAYDSEAADRLAPYRVDLVVLASYLYVLSAPMLAAFRHRIINVHHSDLTLRHADGRPRLPGLRAVHDAIVAGASQTRATVHLVTEELDQGPPFLRSWPFPVSPLAADALKTGATGVLKAYAWAHQEWMIRATCGPLLARAIALIAEGEVDLSELAQARPDEWQAPWDLEEHGGLRGYRPLPVRDVDARIA